MAVKEFLTQSQADAFQDEDELPPGGIHTYHDVMNRERERERALNLNIFIFLFFVFLG